MADILLENIESGVEKKPMPNPLNWQFSMLTLAKDSAKNILPKKVSLKDKFGACYKQVWNNCTTNAAVACDAYYYHDPKGVWVPSTTFTFYVQRAMVDKSLTKENTGTSVENALDAVRKYGVCNSTVWPNDISYKKKPTTEAYKDGLKGHEVTKYYQVKNLSQVKQALAKGYPVAVAMAWAFRTCDGNTWKLNEVSKAEAKKCNCGHAVVIVGYDEERKVFEIRNSHGSDWCNHGYAYISYDTMKNVIWFDDSYAVVR